MAMAQAAETIVFASVDGEILENKAVERDLIGAFEFGIPKKLCCAAVYFLCELLFVLPIFRVFMARTLEELIILKRTALKYLLARESRLLALGKKPVNKKIAQFVKSHEETNVWSSFSDSLSEDLTKNINVFEWRQERDDAHELKRRTYRLNSASRDSLRRYQMSFWGGRMSEAPIVRVEQGELQGRVVPSPSGKAYYSFQGIPYARAPLGSLRFRAPQPAEPWEGVRDATAEGNIAAQFDPLIHKQFVGDENCLFLNVYTPNLDGAFLPVMVFIHGGAFKFGSGNTSLYGADYLVEKDVIVVTINYRVGPLGFLCLNTPEVPGNAGMKDVVEAIRWVKANIENFGGNSGNVTVFGESAGGAAVSLLTASPLSKNLISKAIIQSGTALNSWAMQTTPLDNAKELAQILGCDSEDPEDILEFLTTTPVRELVDGTEKMYPPEKAIERGINSFSVVIEKEFPGVESLLNEAFIDILTSGRVAEIPVMIGSTTLEFASQPPNEDLRPMIPKDFNLEINSEEAVALAEEIKRVYFKTGHIGVESLHEYFQLLSDKIITLDTHRYVKYLVQVTNKPIYYYKFDYVGELNFSGKLFQSLGMKNAGHMDELGYLFKNVFQKEVEPTSQDVKTRERLLRLWTNFAKGGNPTPDENHYLTVTWLPVTKDNLYYLNLGSELSLGTNPDKERMDFWERQYNKYYKIWDHPKVNNAQVPEKRVLSPEPETEIVASEPEVIASEPEVLTPEPEALASEPEVVSSEPEVVTEPVNQVQVVETAPTVVETTEIVAEELKPQNGDVEIQQNGNGLVEKTENLNLKRTSNEIKMVQSNGVAKDVIRANDPPEDDLPKNIGVNKFVNFFESLGGKK